MPTSIRKVSTIFFRPGNTSCHYILHFIFDVNDFHLYKFKPKSVSLKIKKAWRSLMQFSSLFPLTASSHQNFLILFTAMLHLGCWRPEYEGYAGSRSQRRSSGRYGDYGCDSPWELVESAINHMMKRQDVDFLLWTG